MDLYTGINEADPLPPPDSGGHMAVSFVMACSKFFGRRPNQSLMEFNQELKQLTPQDRVDMAKMLTEVSGVEVEDVPPVKSVA